MMEEPFLPLLYPARRIAWQVGIGGLIFSFVGASFQPQAFFLSYLFAYLFWLGISLGGMTIVMIHHLTGGTWGDLTRRSLEAAAQALPLMAVLFIPLLFGLSDLYVWAHPAAVAEDTLLQKKSAYLNVPFFLMRAGVYFAIWWSLIHWLSKWSAEQARNPQPAISLRLQRLSAAGIILYSLSITFAATDWVLSLVPQWYSTAFGLLWGVGQTVSALAFVIIVAIAFSKSYSLAKIFTPDRFHDLGNFLLLLIMLWAYMAFMQYLIIWSEDLPHEIAWYLPRAQGGWQGLTVAVFALHFVIPFGMLLFRYVKRTPNILAGIAALVLLAHFMESFWLVVPSLRTQSFQLYWSDFMAPLGIGGIWIATVLGQIQRRPLGLARSPPVKTQKQPTPAIPAGKIGRQHEVSDARGRSIAWLAFILIAMLVVIASIVFTLFTFFGNRQSVDRDYFQTDIEKKLSTPLSLPLEVKPGVGVRELQKEKEELLHSGGWVNKEEGIVHIPIEEAMKLLEKEKRLVPGKTK